MMNEPSKITSDHLRRSAIVYIRQSSATQVEHNRESTARQYQLAERAEQLGWPREQINVVDDDLGISGSGLGERSGFARMTSEVALGHVGIVLGLEVSRLARNNADWYRLLDLCSVPKSHERRLHGHRHAGIRIVLEGPTLVHALDAHVAHPAPFTAEDLLPYRTAQEPPCQEQALNRRKIMRKARSKKSRPKLLADLEQR